MLDRLEHPTFFLILAPLTKYMELCVCVNKNVDCLQKDHKYVVVDILAYLVVVLQGSVSAHSSLQTYQGFQERSTAHLTPSYSEPFHKSNS